MNSGRRAQSFPTALICRGLPVALCLVVCGSSVRSAGGADLQVSATDVQGRTYSGRLSALSDAAITLVGEAAATLKTSDLVTLTFDTAPAQPVAYVSILRFENGDRMIAWVSKIENGVLSAIWPPAPGSPITSVPLETLQSVRIESAAPPDSHEPLPRGEDMVAGDVVILENGDHITGEVSQLDGTALSLETDGGQRKIGRTQIRAVVMNPQLVSFPEATGPRCLLRMTDGSRLTGRKLQLTDDGNVRLEALFGASLQVPLELVASIRFLGGRVEYLSDLEPAGFEFTPYLSARWPLGRDENVLGGPLMLRGREYAKGLGMHSRSVVRYRLDGRYKSFQAVAGIDDCTSGRGNVIFAVERDGVRVFTSDPQSGRDPPLTVGPVDVANSKELTLIVDFGHLADIQDRADWCEARLIR